jgi:hypothetical protein
MRLPAVEFHAHAVLAMKIVQIASLAAEDDLGLPDNAKDPPRSWSPANSLLAAATFS